MPAYLIVDITVTEPGGYAAYREKAPAVVAQFGGRYLVRGGTQHPLEGDLGFDRCVVVEFPSLEAAQDFYASPAYAPLLKQRTDSTRSRMMLVEGA